MVMSKNCYGEERERGVTVIVNCHDEGHLLWRSLLSALATLKHFKVGHEKRGAELLILADTPNQATIDVAARFVAMHDSDDIAVEYHDVKERDLGKSRNRAVERAAFDHVSFLDADDLFCESWVSKAWEYLQTQDVPTVAHPQVNLNFERDMLVWQHTDSRDPAFDPSVFCLTNHWTARTMAPTVLLEAHPYKHASSAEGVGFEDWEWNERTLAAGVVHAVIPETVHFIRKRGGSMSHEHAGQSRITHENDFWTKPWVYKGPAVESPRAMGDWIVEEWKKAHECERELWPHPRELMARPAYTPTSAKPEYTTYHLLNEAVPKGATHLILFAGLGGGADLRVKWYADAVKAKGGRAALIATDGHGWVDGHHVTQAHKMLSKLPPYAQARTLQRLMRQKRVAGMAIHIVNSGASWGALGANQNLFKRPKAPKIFGSLYARELYADGSSGGYAFNGAFGSAAEAVDWIITDNAAFRDELYESMGWVKTIIAPTPAPTAARSLASTETAPWHIPRYLWASRVDWNKNLGIVVELAKALPKAEFHVFGGAADWHGQQALAELSRMRNCTLHGPYKAFSDIVGEYDAFLFTSRQEGSPNVVQEAIAAGLPVVTTDVGDVREYVNLSCIVPQGAAVERWTLALAEALYTPDPIQGRSFESFCKMLGDVDYFETIHAVEQVEQASA